MPAADTPRVLALRCGVKTFPCPDPWCDGCRAAGPAFQALMVVLHYAHRRVAKLERERPKYVSGEERRLVNQELGFATQNVFDNFFRGERYLSADELIRFVRHPVLRFDLLGVIANSEALQAVARAPELLHKDARTARLSNRSFFRQFLIAVIVDGERRQLMSESNERTATLELVSEAIANLMAVAASLQDAGEGQRPGSHDWRAAVERLQGHHASAASGQSMRQLVLAEVPSDGTTSARIRAALNERGVACSARDIAQATSSLRRTGHIEPTGIRGVWRLRPSKGKD